MKLESGCIVSFRTRGIQYKGGYIPKETTGRVAKIAPEGVYVTTGMAMWLVPLASIVNVRPARKPTITTPAVAVSEAG